MSQITSADAGQKDDDVEAAGEQGFGEDDRLRVVADRHFAQRRHSIAEPPCLPIKSASEPAILASSATTLTPSSGPETFTPLVIEQTLQLLNLII